MTSTLPRHMRAWQDEQAADNDPDDATDATMPCDGCGATMRVLDGHMTCTDAVICRKCWYAGVDLPPLMLGAL